VGTYVVVGAVNAFHVSGVLFAVWAITLTTLGLTREDFPRTQRLARLVGALSVVLAVGTIGSAIAVGALEGNEKGGKTAAGNRGTATGGELRLSADPSGQLKFDKSALQANAGTITIAMTNPSAVPHDISVEGGGLDKKGKIVTRGGTSTFRAKLKSGTYTFYCSVDAHRQAGMNGKLTVR
jgi:plastocyanin